MKVFIAGLVTESTSFSPFRTSLADFERAGPDGKLLGAMVGSVLDVFRRRAEERGWEVRQGLAAGAMPGGPVTRSAYAALRSELLDSLAQAGEVNAVLLFLHGAMLAEGEDDPEGDLLAAIRARVGPGVPIGVEIDPHANLSDRMVEHADVLVAFKEWPHVDPLDRAHDVFDLVAAMVERGVRPVRAVHECRMLSLFHTMELPTRELLDDIRAREGKNGILSISFIHGYPFADVPDAGAKMLVIANRDVEKARAVAKELGERVWAMRGKTHPRHLGLEEGLDQVVAAGAHPVLVADISDAPGAGAPGDATFVIRGLLERGVRNVAVAYLWDPVMTDVAITAGVGAELALRLGGKMGPASGTPLDLTCRVVNTAPDARVMTPPAGQSEEAGHPVAVPVGDLAVVESQGISIVLSKERPVAMHAGHFAQVGIPPAAQRVLVVKSVNNFRAGFEAVAGTFVYIAGPGALSTNLRLHPYRRIRRPMWPLDDEESA